MHRHRFPLTLWNSRTVPAKFCDLLLQKVILSLELLDLHEITLVLIEDFIRIMEAMVEVGGEGLKQREERRLEGSRGVDLLIFHSGNRYKWLIE